MSATTKLRALNATASLAFLAACGPAGPSLSDTVTEGGSSETEPDTETRTEPETELGTETETESPADEPPDDPPDTTPEGPRPEVLSFSLGQLHGCALLEDASIACWGRNESGQLGLGHTENIGYEQYTCGRVDIGGPAQAVVAGQAHSCALREDGAVLCWGRGLHGQLGSGHIGYVGNDERPVEVGPVELAESVTGLWAGGSRTCARTVSDEVLCWGGGASSMGYGVPTSAHLGDDEPPDSLGPLTLGGSVDDMVIGGPSCALLEGGALRCWGADSPSVGADYGEVIGDDESPATVPPLELGGAVVAVAGAAHVCAVIEGGDLRCWGSNGAGQLGYGMWDPVGHDPTPIELDPVELGEAASGVGVGKYHSCAIAQSGALYCWGSSEAGALGYPNIEGFIGGDLLPVEVGPVELPGPVDVVDGGWNFTCAQLDADLYCWGDRGALGVASAEDIGDDEPPASLGPLHFGNEQCEGIPTGASELDGLVDARLHLDLADPQQVLPLDFEIGATVRIQGTNHEPGCEECELSFVIRSADDQRLLALAIMGTSLDLRPGLLPSIGTNSAAWTSPLDLSALDSGQCAPTPSCDGVSTRLSLQVSHPDAPTARLLDHSRGLVGGGYMSSVHTLAALTPGGCMDEGYFSRKVVILQQDCAPDCGPVAWIDSCEEPLGWNELDDLRLEFEPGAEPTEYGYDISCEILDISDESDWQLSLDCAGIP